MSDNLNYFKHITLIKAGSPELLALKLGSIRATYQLNAVWSDGKEHYALINAHKKLSVRELEKINTLTLDQA